jgi:hypothetical protein
MDFAIDSINKQLSFGIEQELGFCLGSGKNYNFLLKLNAEQHFFKKIIPLEHPRFIMQYRLRQKEFYINNYIEKLSISEKQINKRESRKKFFP